MIHEVCVSLLFREPAEALSHYYICLHDRQTNTDKTAFAYLLKTFPHVKRYTKSKLSVSLFGNYCLYLHHYGKRFNKQIHISTCFVRRSKDILKSLPKDAQKKIAHNINKVAAGFSNTELFKKIGKF